MSDDLISAAQIAEWRQKALNNQLSSDELRAFVIHCREGRVAAARTSAKSRAAKAPIDMAGLMDEIDNI